MGKNYSVTMIGTTMGVLAKRGVKGKGNDNNLGVVALVCGVLNVYILS